MFSPQIAPTEPSRARGRGRRNPIRESARQRRPKDSSTAPSPPKPTREDPVVSLRISGRNDDAGQMENGVDESVTWNENAKYKVSLLPALPDCLKIQSYIIGGVDPRYRHALILSHTSAWVWNYADGRSSPHTYLFMLPQDEAVSRDSPYPLGTIVSPSANSEEPGLVVVMPLTGRIAYWEAIGSAAAEGLFAKKRGVESKIALSAGETVTAICSIEPAGFILSLSSGRLAHLSLRDATGKPGISTTILKDPRQSSGILGFLSAASQRRDVVAVRAGRTGKRGHREVIVATAKGALSKWYVERGGNFNVMPEADLREQMLRAVEKANPRALSDRRSESFCVLDVAVGANEDAGSIDSDESDLDCFILTGFVDPNEDDAYYFLVEISLRFGGRGEVKQVYPIKSYMDPIEVSQHFRPRVYVPSPRNTAFIVFGKAVIVLSNLKPLEGEGRRAITEGDMDVDRQLLGEEEEEERKAVFEDVIDFNADVSINVIGSGGEDILYETFRPEDALMGMSGDLTRKKIGNPGVVLLAKGAGVLRVEAFDAENDRKEKGVFLSQERVKSKIEQAVYFGHIGKNPLNFAGRREVQFQLDDIEKAAVDISTEILSTATRYLPRVLPSMSNHLELRGQRLRALADHLRATYPTLSAGVRWQLLQDAEKCEAARALWVSYDESNIREESSEDILSTIITRFMGIQSNADDADSVRLWFTHYLQDIGNLLGLARRVYSDKSTQGRRAPAVFSRVVYRANEIVLSALLAAYDFRTRHSGLYGFDSLVDENGLFRSSAAKGFPAPWTSSLPILDSLRYQHENSAVVLKSYFGKNIEAGIDFIEPMTQQMEDLAELICREYLERIWWSEQQDIPELREEDAVRELFEKERGRWVQCLIPLGRSDGAYIIAEKYKDFRTLVEICSAEMIQLDSTPVENLDENQREEVARQRVEVLGRLETYLDKFKEPFAQELYEYKVETGSLRELLEQFKAYDNYLTKFLHSSNRYAKLAWMHDVSRGDYVRAGSTLINIAHQQEDGLWARKIELSIGKLCGLAGLEDTLDRNDNLSTIHKYTDGPLSTIKIQEELYGHMTQIVRGAIDREAEIDLALKEKGSNLRRRPNMKDTFQQGLNLLFNMKAMPPETLIDILTLMDDKGERLKQFYFALQVLKDAALNIDRRRLAEQAIWRRCYIHDDWASIVDTKRKSDEEVKEEAQHTALFITLENCYKNRLFDESFAIRPLTPEESLFSESVNELRYRFREKDDVELAAYSNELSQENKLLNKYITKARLVSWCEAIHVMVQEKQDNDSSGKQYLVSLSHDDGDIEMQD